MTASSKQSNPPRYETYLSRFLEWMGRRSEAQVIVLILVPPCLGVLLVWLLPAYQTVFWTMLLSAFLTWVMGIFWAFGTFVKWKRSFLFRQTQDIVAVRALKWEDFEHFVAEVFRRHGYIVEQRGGDQPDGGIDLVLAKDGKRYCVQCKQWRVEQVSGAPIRELYGVMARGGFDGAFFVTGGAFSVPAREEFDGDSRLKLLDGSDLIEMVQKVGPDAGEVKKSVTDAVASFLAKVLESEGLPYPVIRVPSCPKCNHPMFLKVKDDNRFWACRKWPQCPGGIVGIAETDKEFLDHSSGKPK